MIWIGLFNDTGHEVNAPDYSRLPSMEDDPDVTFVAGTNWGRVRWYGVFEERIDCPPITTFELSTVYNLCLGDQLHLKNLREKLRLK